MTANRLLIVGFGAFPRVPRNPSADLARRIAASPRLHRVLGTPPRCLVLRTAYAALASDLAPALAERPAAVLMIGVAMRAKRIRVESRARNRATRLFPDADGRTPEGIELDRHGPAERISRQALPALVVLDRHGIAAGGSRDAGAYLCNASYFRVLAEACPALFLHIPRPPGPGRRSSGVRWTSRQPLDRWTDAFVDVALLLLAHARQETVHRPSDEGMKGTVKPRGARVLG